MKDYFIERSGPKGRSFEAHLLAAAVGNYFEGSSCEWLRPVWAMFAASEHELRPFVANLRLGKKARTAGDDVHERIEFMRSVGYTATWQRTSAGSIVSLFHPDVVRLDPGMVDGAIQFVMLVPETYCASQKIERAEDAVRYCSRFDAVPLTEDDLTALVPVACLFAAYLDRRTRCPLIPDPRFHLQLLIAALGADMATRAGDDLRQYRSGSWGFGRHAFNAVGLERVGISHAIGFNSTQENFESFLSHHTSLFLKEI